MSAITPFSSIQAAGLPMPVFAKTVSLAGYVISTFLTHPMASPMRRLVIPNIGKMVGEIMIKLTQGRMDLNRLVSKEARVDVHDRCQKILCPIGKGASSLLAMGSGEMGEIFAVATVVSPVLEELLMRGPQILVAQIFDLLSSQIPSPELKGLVCLVGQVVKYMLAIGSSVAFAYGHDDGYLSSAQAFYYFTAGLMLSYHALKPGGGLGAAIFEHSMLNLQICMLACLLKNEGESA